MLSFSDEVEPVILVQICKRYYKHMLSIIITFPLEKYDHYAMLKI